MRRRLAAFLFAVATGVGVAGQSSPAEAIDPFTKGEPAALARAGYAALGSIPFGTQHNSRDVADLLRGEPLLWIETAHFRIGCALSSLKLQGDGDWVARTKKEIAELRKRLPTLPADCRDLQPWLRAHLIALRCEAIYAEVRATLGVTDAMFEAPESRDPERVEYLGPGPHLGMSEKFAVLLLQKGSNLARYSRRYMGGRETMEPYRYCPSGGPHVFAIAEESAEGRMRDDFALHTQLAYNLTWMLFDGYRGTAIELPAWLALGLSHAQARRISPRFAAWERRVGGEGETSDFWKWGDRARGLAKHGAFEPLAALIARTDAAAFGMEQQIEAWAFVDWALQHRRKELMGFLHHYRDPTQSAWMAGRTKGREERIAACWSKAFGRDIAAVEAEWRTALVRGRK